MGHPPLSAPADKGGVLGCGVHARRVPRASCAVFLSGNRAATEFRDGNAGYPRDPHLPDSGHVILSHLLATVVQDKWRGEAAMILRAFFLHYRMVREAITTVVAVGTAVLLSYLILWMRL